MEGDIKENKNEPELTYPYKEMDPLIPPLPASESEPKDVTEVENPIKHNDETVLASVHEVAKSSNTPFLREDNDGILLGLMRRDINSLFGQMASLSRRLCGREKAHALVEKKRKSKGQELKEARFSNTFLRMQNKRVERDIYWTRVQAHEFYQEMIHRGFVFEERPNEAIDVSVKNEERTPKESREESS
nr:hypothetical protein [Tanacetum cinerariifolium]